MDYELPSMSREYDINFLTSMARHINFLTSRGGKYYFYYIVCGCNVSKLDAAKSVFAKYGINMSYHKTQLFDLYDTCLRIEYQKLKKNKVGYEFVDNLIKNKHNIDMTDKEIEKYADAIRQNKNILTRILSKVRTRK